MVHPSQAIVVDIDRFVLVIGTTTLTLYNQGELVGTHDVPAMVDAIGTIAHNHLQDGTLRVGYIDYGEFEVISVYDAGDPYGFGYHWNITDSYLSEWGDSSDLPSGDESIGDFVARKEAWMEEMRASMGDAFIVAGPEAIRRVVSTPKER